MFMQRSTGDVFSCNNISLLVSSSIPHERYKPVINIFHFAQLIEKKFYGGTWEFPTSSFAPISMALYLIHRSCSEWGTRGIELAPSEMSLTGRVGTIPMEFFLYVFTEFSEYLSLQ